MQCEIAEVAICFQAGKGFDGEQSRNSERSSTIRLTTWPIHQQNVAFPCLKLCSGRSHVSGSGSKKNGVSKYEGGPNLGMKTSQF